MRFKMMAALAAVSMSAVSFAQAAPDFTAEGFRSHVAFLADDLLEGREAGTRGYDIAARYVATQFEGLGLKAAGTEGWYQPVPFVTYKLGETPATLTIGGRTFENGKEVSIGASAREPNQSLEAPVVFAGYGIDAPGQGFNDYAGLDVKGKVVAVLSGFPKGTPSELAAHLNSQKSKMAQDRGAIGVVYLRTLSEQKRRPWTNTAQSSREASMTWVGTDGQPFSNAPGIRFTATLDTPAAEALFAGAKTPLASVLAKAEKDGAKPKGFALKQPIKIDRQSVVDRATSPNVLAILPGSDPKLAGEYVLLMAHLDHEGINPAREGRTKSLMARWTMRPASRRCSKSRARWPKPASARAARFCSPPSPPRRRACSARNISPSIRWSATANWWASSISTCRSCSTTSTT